MRADPGALIETLQDGAPELLTNARAVFQVDWDVHTLAATSLGSDWSDGIITAPLLHEPYEDLEPLAEASRHLLKQADQLFTLADKANRDVGGKRGKAGPVHD